MTVDALTTIGHLPIDILMAGGSMRFVTPNRLNVLNPSTFLFQPPKVVFLIVLSVVAVISLASIACNAQSSFRSSNDELSHQIYYIEVVNEFHHDPTAFTQGLLYGGNNTLFESTGLHGNSSVRKVSLQTAKIEALHKMDDSYFGEGLTLLGERLYQLTWLTQTGFIYDRHNLSKFEKFRHHMNDGWGFATDGKILFGSDGSSSLYHIDPQTMKVIAKQVIKYKDNEVHNLNELEYINNEVWANIWMRDCIVRISPLDGSVTGWIILPELREALIAAGYKIDVLNGIAWDADNERIFVTGKLWPKLYQIKVHPRRKPLDFPLDEICLPGPIDFASMNSK